MDDVAGGGLAVWSVVGSALERWVGVLVVVVSAAALTAAGLAARRTVGPRAVALCGRADPAPLGRQHSSHYDGHLEVTVGSDDREPGRWVRHTARVLGCLRGRLRAQYGKQGSVADIRHDGPVWCCDLRADQRVSLNAEMTAAQAWPCRVAAAYLVCLGSLVGVGWGEGQR